jgi:hypothetical protein
MDRKVDISPKQRSIDSIGEVRGASRSEVTVAARIDCHSLASEFRCYPREPGQDNIGLRAGEMTPASPDPDKIGHRPVDSGLRNRSASRHGRGSLRGGEKHGMSPTQRTSPRAGWCEEKSREHERL